METTLDNIQSVGVLQRQCMNFAQVNFILNKIEKSNLQHGEHILKICEPDVVSLLQECFPEQKIASLIFEVYKKSCIISPPNHMLVLKDEGKLIRTCPLKEDVWIKGNTGSFIEFRKSWCGFPYLYKLNNLSNKARMVIACY